MAIGLTHRKMLFSALPPGETVSPDRGSRITRAPHLHTYYIQGPTHYY